MQESCQLQSCQMQEIHQEEEFHIEVPTHLASSFTYESSTIMKNAKVDEYPAEENFQRIS